MVAVHLYVYFGYRLVLYFKNIQASLVQCANLFRISRNALEIDGFKALRKPVNGHRECATRLYFMKRENVSRGRSYDAPLRREEEASIAHYSIRHTQRREYRSRHRTSTFTVSDRLFMTYWKIRRNALHRRFISRGGKMHYAQVLHYGTTGGRPPAAKSGHELLIQVGKLGFP